MACIFIGYVLWCPLVYTRFCLVLRVGVRSTSAYVSLFILSRSGKPGNVTQLYHVSDSSRQCDLAKGKIKSIMG